MHLKTVKNSDFQMYCDVDIKTNDRIVKFAEKNLRNCVAMMPEKFEMPKIAIVDFEKHGLNKIAGGDAIGGYHRESNTMFINSKYDTKQKIVDYLKRDNNFASSTADAPYMHELGHKRYYDAIKNLANREKIDYNKAENIIKGKIGDVVHEEHNNGRNIRRTISKYAYLGYIDNNMGEIAAECNTVQQKEIARKILNALESR